jgi:putative ABC transport system permease protein
MAPWWRATLTFLRPFPRPRRGQPEPGTRSRLRPGADAEDLVAARLRRGHLDADVKVLTKGGYVAFEQAYRPARFAGGRDLQGMGTVMAFVVGVVIVYQVLSTDVALAPGASTPPSLSHRVPQPLPAGCGVRAGPGAGRAWGLCPGSVLPLGIDALASNATFLPIAMTGERAIKVFLLMPC